MPLLGRAVQFILPSLWPVPTIVRLAHPLLSRAFSRRMNCLSVERLAKRYGPRQLFTDISFGLEKGQKTAIVARNGTGNSKLLTCGMEHA